jgi:hypothetical protein
MCFRLQYKVQLQSASDGTMICHCLKADVSSRERIAVRSFGDFWTSLCTLKRDALLFDRIGVSDLNSNLAWASAYPPDPTDTGTITIAELEYLSEQKLLFEPNLDIANPRFANAAVYRDYQATQSNMTGMLRRAVLGDLSEQQASRSNVVEFELGGRRNLEQINVRINAALLELEGNVDACPLLLVALDSVPSDPCRESTKRDVVEIVFRDMPVPQDDVSWERIFDLRSDPELCEQRRRLQQWIETVSAGNRNLGQIREEYEGMASDRRSYFRKQKIEFWNGLCSTLTVAGIELGTKHNEFPWGAAATGLFEIRRSIKSLLECEDKAPGRPLAFIDSSKKAFAR